VASAAFATPLTEFEATVSAIDPNGLGAIKPETLPAALLTVSLLGSFIASMMLEKAETAPVNLVTIYNPETILIDLPASSKMEPEKSKTLLVKLRISSNYDNTDTVALATLSIRDVF
jgi:hypothetical protein